MRPQAQALPVHPVSVRRRRRSAAARLLDRFVHGYLALPIGVAIALVWANTAPERYFITAHALAFPVNEIGMALFIGLIMQEIVEAVMPGGALHSWRRWTLPLIAAAGGIAGSAGLYLGYVQGRYETILTAGWPIACAVDIAAAYYVLKSILIALGVAGGMRALNVRRFGPYLVICGTLSWIALYREGLHPAFALVPIVPFLPHEPRRLDLLADPPDDDAVHHFEHEWNTVVQVILFLFGLVNGGVMLRGYDTGTWALLLAALVGRPLGIVTAVGAAVAVGWHLPRGLGWRQLVVTALASSSGFTFALFFATGILSTGPLLAQLTIGALGTAAGSLLAIGTARLLRVGRFAR
jgi:NhaA family Na+:H+ antiporter